MHAHVEARRTLTLTTLSTRFLRLSDVVAKKVTEIQSKKMLSVDELRLALRVRHVFKKWKKMALITKVRDQDEPPSIKQLYTMAVRPDVALWRSDHLFFQSRPPPMNTWHITSYSTT